MILAIIDNREKRRDGLAEYLRRQNHHVYTYDGQRWRDPEKEDPEERGIPPRIEGTLFHVGNSSDWDAIRGIVGIERCVVWYSGVGVSGCNGLTPRGWAVHRPILGPEDLREHEWHELLGWMANGERPTEPGQLPEAFRPQRTQRIAIALLILCRGFLAVTKGEVIGLTVKKSAVDAPEWWAQPFKHIEDVEELLRAELGTRDLPDPMPTLLNWIFNKAELSEYHLTNVVKEVEKLLTARLQSP